MFFSGCQHSLLPEHDTLAFCALLYSCASGTSQYWPHCVQSSRHSQGGGPRVWPSVTWPSNLPEGGGIQGLASDEGLERRVQLQPGVKLQEAGCKSLLLFFNSSPQIYACYPFTFFFPLAYFIAPHTQSVCPQNDHTRTVAEAIMASPWLLLLILLIIMQIYH